MPIDALTNEFARLNSQYMPGGDRLVIALDFGTTFSGVAYAFTNDPEQVDAVKSWPGGDDRIVPKTPTTLLYDKGSTDNFKWGYQLNQSFEDKIIGLKLLLDPEQQRPYWIPTNIEAEMAKLPKDVLEVAADYMKAIFDHALSEIENGYMPGFVRDFSKQYVLTVPAVWSDKAKDMTLRAARRAGISPVDMITEPEAAALFTLRSMKDKGLGQGDAIVICDAGGGTVDLVSYEITSMSPFEPTEAWAAVVKGAVMSKLPRGPSVPRVVSTRSPKHYGTSANNPWDSFRDRGRRKMKHQWEEYYMCEIMQWFIYKEDELVRDQKKQLTFWRDFPGHSPTKQDLQVVGHLYECNSILAPDHPEKDVKVNVTLKTDLSKVPREHFQRLARMSDGAAYSSLEYNLQIEHGQSGLMKFSIEVDGKVYGAVDASY